MAPECEGCGRRNADAAHTCLYCGTPLQGGDAPRDRRSNPVHLVWSPAGTDGAADALEGLLGIDTFRARLLARSPVPRILRTLGHAAEARDLHERAAGLGLATFLVDEHTLETRPAIEPVVEAVVEVDALVLRSAASTTRIRPGSLRLAVTSRVEVKRVRRSSRITMMSSEPGSTPGVPRMVRESTSTGDHRRVLDVYPRDAEIGLRVREESTRVAGTGLPAQPSALLKFLFLVDRLRQLDPELILDEQFSLFDDLLDDGAHRIEVRPGVTVLDGVGRFERYSRLLWLAQEHGKQA